MTLRKMWTRLQDPDNGTNSGGEGAASAPAPSLAPAPSAAPAASGASNESAGSASSGEDFDFGALADFASGKETTEPPVQTAAAPAAPAPSPAPAVAAPAPAPAAPAPAPAPAAPTEPQAAPQPAATAQTPASSEQPPQQVDWEKHRQEFIPKLEQMYGLSPEEVQDFQTNPGEVIPKLAAKLHYNVTMALQAAIREYMPHVVTQQFAHREVSQRLESQFYAKWPRLKEAVAKDPKVEATINEGIQAFRAANPKASLDDLMSKVGLLAMISLGMNPLEQMTGAPPPAPAAPTGTPMIPGRPAGAGGQGHVPVRAHGAAPGESGEEDLYSAMAAHFMSGGG